MMLIAQSICVHEKSCILALLLFELIFVQKNNLYDVDFVAKKENIKSKVFRKET